MERGAGEPILYEIEVEGQVGPRWRDWFQADAVLPRGDNSILQVRVADQSELFGRLRRIHDLNLRLIALTRVDPALDGTMDDRTQEMAR